MAAWMDGECLLQHREKTKEKQVTPMPQTGFPHQVLEVIATNKPKDYWALLYDLP